VHATHIPGQENAVADALSRQEIAATLDCAIEQFTVLRTCHACQLPYALLLHINNLLSNTTIRAPFVQKTKELLTIGNFATWCASYSLPPTVLEMFPPGELLTIVCRYSAEVAKGNNITRSESLADDTIMGYVNAAVAWLRCNTYKEVPLFTNEGGSRQDRRLNPVLAALHADQQKWTRKRELRLPLTGPILYTMEYIVAEENGTLSPRRTDDTAALYDWIILGIFTGPPQRIRTIGLASSKQRANLPTTNILHRNGGESRKNSCETTSI
jgi:hypothetical protein